jgi:hypothetical protein
MGQTPLKTLPAQLIGLSISAEFFDTFGFVICGLNPTNNMTEIYWFDTKKNRWTMP